ncbi:polarity axis stabilization protein [Ceratobasidium sp. AG-Ba]|nr:polarity axis stabilization protein [Ceratobasidium sp. AG-Ba]
MEEDVSGDIGLSTPIRQPRLLNDSGSTTRRAPPPAIDLPPPSAAMWKAPSPGSPTVMSPTSATPPLSVGSPPLSARLTRSRTMPRLSSRLEPQLYDFTREEAENLEPEKVEALQRWVVSVAVVDFDLDIGPVVAKLYPSIKLSAPDRENIAFSSFPDTTLFDTGTQTHSFKIRLSQTLSIVSKDSVRDIGVIYGYACFMQRKDPTSKRGYLQRSIVFLTHLPYIGIFDRAINLFGPMFFTHGNAMLQSGCLNVCSWPDPTPGCTLELGLLGSVITAELPRSDEEQQHLYKLLSEDSVVIASLPMQSIIQLLADILPKLWECLVLCDPILVFAPSPAISSAVVWWLRDLIRPLPFAGDIRPYFHIHDRDFNLLVSKNAPRPGLILGVTNPYFENVCKHWPHTLSIGSSGTPVNGAGKGKSATALASQSFGPSIGYHTKHNRYIGKDSALLKKLEAAVKAGPKEQFQVTELARQHFAQRSQQILAPLNRYFSSLLPKPPDSSSPALSAYNPSPSPSLNVPSPSSSRTPSPALRSKPISPATSSIGTSVPDYRVKPFNTKDFFASLKKHGAQLPFRSPGKQKEFYERWLKSPAFGAWISGRVDAAQNVLV